MGFLSNIISSTVKVALTPVAIVADSATKIVTGEKLNATKSLLKSAVKDVEDATDDLADGDIL